MIKEVEIKSETGILKATIYAAEQSNSLLLISSATGVKQTFYKKFAEYIASHNISVITYDYCGIGQSLTKPIKELKHNAADWGSKDLESVVDYALTHFPNHTKTLLGHSIGGQLIGLSKSSSNMDKIVMVAAQSGYWKYWKGAGKLKMWFYWHVLFPLLTSMFGYLPSKRVSGMENLPKNVARQWSRWSKTSDYMLSDTSIEHMYFKNHLSDISAFSIDDDAFAPREAVEWMTKRFVNAQITSQHLRPQDFNVSKIGHFGIFKDKFKDSIWKLLLSEIK